MYTSYYSHRDLQFEITKAGEEAVTCHDQPSFLVQVNIKFSCKTTLRVINPTYNEFSPEYVVAELQQPEISNSVCIEPHQILSYRKSYEIILDAVRTWPIPNIEYLIKNVIFEAWARSKSISPNNNLLLLDVDTKVVNDHILDETSVFEDVVQQSLEESDGDSMVPAKDSSIKSLERKIIDDQNINSGSCMICLDEFPIGSKAICMPCSHMFHSSCLKKWLRTSHYCPICRFEIPTN
ncbi:Ubiquitin--protein ligase [Abeliophyllum distichum]|uniref:RING-type E3 ubiquitin transferase n=1 Tax=Abeliophyllum distichum TaxID=126358 RepID=A0ABD1SBV2_9LAMI